VPLADGGSALTSTAAVLAGAGAAEAAALAAQRGDAEQDSADHHQGHPEGKEVARDRRRLPQVADVSLVLVEGRIDGEGAAVEEDDPEHEPERRRAQGDAGRGGRQPDGQQVAERRMRRHDGPFGGAGVEEVVERGAEQPVAGAAKR